MVGSGQSEPTGAAPIEGIGLQLQYWSAVRARGACLTATLGLRQALLALLELEAEFGFERAFLETLLDR